MKIENFLIDGNCSIKDALTKIDNNSFGIIFSQTKSGEVYGVATDGDIRRSLIAGLGLDDKLDKCINKEFHWEDNNVSREALIKKLDQKIKVIPILDSKMHLVDVITKENLPEIEEMPVYARAKSPVRISFGGGGSDLTHYFSNGIGAVINATVSFYSHATLHIRSDSKIIIHSLDLGSTLRADNLVDCLNAKGEFGLIQAVIKTVNPDFGFELDLYSDFPMSSGLGGSAVVAASILGCFNQFRKDQWSLHELSELAYEAERLHQGVEGGWQDQYATIFGGFNFIEFKMDQNVVHPLRIPPEILLELEESLVLCNTGIQHNSGNIHKDQRSQMRSKNKQALVQKNVDLCYKLRNQLLRGSLMEFGKSLDTAWKFKRDLSNEISNSQLDGIYDQAMMNGAIGGKLLGAGGGGFFLFFVPPSSKHLLLSHLEKEGLKASPFRFESDGLKSWKVRL
jgi:D-glycero-alpha-D-manno-heptose-7-phosphate kinase